jgi:hypothetical protein
VTSRLLLHQPPQHLHLRRHRTHQHNPQQIRSGSVPMLFSSMLFANVAICEWATDTRYCSPECDAGSQQDCEGVRCWAPGIQARDTAQS